MSDTSSSEEETSLSSSSSSEEDKRRKKRKEKKKKKKREESSSDSSRSRSRSERYPIFFIFYFIVMPFSSILFHESNILLLFVMNIFLGFFVAKFRKFYKYLNEGNLASWYWKVQFSWNCSQSKSTPPLQKNVYVMKDGK